MEYGKAVLQKHMQPPVGKSGDKTQATDGQASKPGEAQALQVYSAHYTTFFMFPMRYKICPSLLLVNLPMQNVKSILCDINLAKLGVKCK
jgi:hypothetical protein